MTAPGGGGTKKGNVSVTEVFLLSQASFDGLVTPSAHTHRLINLSSLPPHTSTCTLARRPKVQPVKVWCDTFISRIITLHFGGQLGRRG